MARKGGEATNKIILHFSGGKRIIKLKKSKEDTS